MNWTDYHRIKEQLSIIENSVKRMKKILKYGTRDAIEMETTFLKFNYEILLEIKKKYLNEFFDARILWLEEEASEILYEVFSMMLFNDLIT